MTTSGTPGVQVRYEWEGRVVGEQFLPGWEPDALPSEIELPDGRFRPLGYAETTQDGVRTVLVNVESLD